MIRNEADLSELPLVGASLELDFLINVHIYLELTVPNLDWLRSFTLVIKDGKHFLIINENQVTKKLAGDIFLELFEVNFIDLVIHNHVSFFLSEPSLVDSHILGHVVDVEVKDVEHGDANLGLISPNFSCAAMNMTS